MIQTISYYLKGNCRPDSSGGCIAKTQDTNCFNRILIGTKQGGKITMRAVQHQKKEVQRGSEISIFVDFSEHTRTRP